MDYATYRYLNIPPPAELIPGGAVWVPAWQSLPKNMIPDHTYSLCGETGGWLRFAKEADCDAWHAVKDARRAARNRAYAEEVVAAQRARSDEWKALQARSARLRRAVDITLRHHRADMWDLLQARGRRNATRRLEAA